MMNNRFQDKVAKNLSEIPLSVLDLAPVVEGSTPADAFKNSLDLAQHAEKWGYHRYWFAEHHNMPAVASSATSVVIGHIASGTSTIRVGSGGIMLPNHAPLVIAEQFGTLESLHPGRVDLGLGRAPGSDMSTTRALRRDLRSHEDFPAQLEELRNYFNPPGGIGSLTVQAVPGEGLNIPIWLLGSSGFSAQLAAELGLPFAFAAHFAPDYTVQAMQLYHNNFKPSEVLDEPYAMIGLNVVVADTDQEAKRLFTTQQQSFLNLVRGGKPALLKPPVDDMDEIWSPFEKETLENQMKLSAIGTIETVTEKLQTVLNITKADEIMVNGSVFDHAARLYSYELLSKVSK
ncbi:LLM class flavin-dependent oxidoreductase [Gottfriedia acidiceleris]|uniref:LLM class flavin-dependent oxidoreductase n=1 Tax=Gottfriedia acidiceleris TaxID=371036 RepID=A0ABY4JP34_9BACI|nr:LLM class flavin-dependent oxidoreductase [Gottfriedia acidiceleris]UPM55606.1 LLM class flavin-dependent oxidoreductase [Gottfriedia acidiceleris]